MSQFSIPFKPVYKIKASVTLGFGLLALLVCALFPPRAKEVGPRQGPRLFLFHPVRQVEMGRDQSGNMTYGEVSAEIDGARLLAEAMIITAVFGLVTLFFCLEHWNSKGEIIWD